MHLKQKTGEDIAVKKILDIRDFLRVASGKSVHDIKKFRGQWI